MGKSSDEAISQNMLNVLLKDAMEVFAFVDENGIISYINPALPKLTGYNVDELIGDNIFSFIHPEKLEPFKKFLENSLAGIAADECATIRFKCKDGSFKWMECRFNNQRDFPGISAVILHLKDISNYKSTKEKLDKKERRFKRAQTISNLGNWEIDYINNREIWSDEVYRILGLEPGEIKATLENYISRVHPNDRELVRTSIEKAFEEKTAITLTHRIIREDGSIRFVYNESRYEYNNEGEIIGLSGIFHDITDQKKAENALKENALNLEKAFSIALIGTWKYDIVNDKYFWNQSAIDVLGFKNEDIPETFEDYLKFIPQEFKHLVSQSSVDINEDGAMDIEHQIKINDELKWVRTKCHIEYDKEGNPLMSSGIIQNISKHKNIEEKIQKALEEKITLLSEVHHRVKNNLAIVSGLLELQHMEMENPEVKFRLKQSINRISSIAMVHELIYQSESLSSVDIQEYLEKLIPGIMDAMVTKQKEITIDLDIDNCQLSINQAIPLGLLLNELLTNSFKYAFEGRKKGKIAVHLRQLNDELNILYEDDGVGFSKNSDFEQPVNLGLNLIHSQLHQLNASHNVQTDNCFKLNFRFTRESPRV